MPSCRCAWCTTRSPTSPTVSCSTRSPTSPTAVPSTSGRCSRSSSPAAALIVGLGNPSPALVDTVGAYMPGIAGSPLHPAGLFHRQEAVRPERGHRRGRHAGADARAVPGPVDAGLHRPPHRRSAVLGRHGGVPRVRAGRGEEVRPEPGEDQSRRTESP